MVNNIIIGFLIYLSIGALLAIGTSMFVKHIENHDDDDIKGLLDTEFKIDWEANSGAMLVGIAILWLPAIFIFIRNRNGA